MSYQLSSFPGNQLQSTQPPRLHRPCEVLERSPRASAYTYRKTEEYPSIATIIQRLWFSGKIQASHTLLGWSGHSREYCLGPGFDSRWAHRFLTHLLHFSSRGQSFYDV